MSLRELVFQALSNAVENGYYCEAHGSPVAVACDLLDYDADVAAGIQSPDGVSDEQLIRYITEWQQEAKAKELLLKYRRPGVLERIAYYMEHAR